MYAMLLARFKMFPEVKEKGMSSVPRLAAFTSEHVGAPILHQVNDPSTVSGSFDLTHISSKPLQSHFSIKKGAAALGIGTESVICIKADQRCDRPEWSLKTFERLIILVVCLFVPLQW